jgi:aminopeptidase N
MVMVFIIIFLFNSFLNSSVFYDISGRIKNSESYIELKVKTSFDKKGDFFDFKLNKNLDIDKSSEFEFKLIKTEDIFNLWRVYRKDRRKFSSFSINYHGVLDYPFVETEEYERSFKITQGKIDKDGCYLSSESYYYPQFDDVIGGFKFEIRTDGYLTIFPGIRKKHLVSDNYALDQWVSDSPLDYLPLVCGKFYEYVHKTKDYELYVFLRNNDNFLAQRYIDYGVKYIDFYSKLIGKYPYRKFAVVENFWETGYGFPSFTLIGSTVIRFPFILSSSYPHEILHNWFGNGIWVDYEKGNWSEGITAYLSDHLFAELTGKGDEYRMNSLKRYLGLYESSLNLPLTQFKERYSQLTQAVGYDKSLMFFHTLRKEIGDDIFINSIRKFYDEYKFKKAGWDDLKSVFEKVSGRNLSDFFKVYVYDTKIPEIIIENVLISSNSVSFDISSTISLNQKIPLYIYFKNENYRVENIYVSEKLKNFNLYYSTPIAAIGFDNYFDVLRKIDKRETPPTLSDINTSEFFYIYPSSFADIFSSIYKTKTVKPLDELKLNQDGNIYLVGIKPDPKIIKNDYEIIFESNTVIINGNSFNENENTFFLSIRNPLNSSYTLNFVFGNLSNLSKTLPKIIHYSKYSFLVFNNSTNIYSGIWKNYQNPNIYYSDEKFRGRIKRINQKSLTEYPSFIDRNNIFSHIKYLSDELKTRHPGSKELNEAANYIKSNFEKYGLVPFFGKSYFEEFKNAIGNTTYTFVNVCGSIKGKEDKYIVLSAHYDHLLPYNGILYPGANDNASGVSVLLELARYFSNKDMRYGLIFCAFSSEEYNRAGSRFFVENYDTKKIISNINIDSIGRMDDRNIRVIFSKSSIWDLVLKNASKITSINYIDVNIPLDSSDNVSFMEKNIPSIQIFDGGNEDYHKPSDTYEKINYDGILLSGDFVIEVIREINKLDSMPFYRIDLNKRIKRKVSLGFMPDFDFGGKGVRIKKIIDGVIKKTDLKEGDIILKINGIDIDNLITYTNVLSSLNPDDEIEINYLSGNELKRVKIDLRANYR